MATWRKFESQKRKNVFFWHNMKTKESRWSPPPKELQVRTFVCVALRLCRQSPDQSWIQFCFRQIVELSVLCVPQKF